MFKPGQVYKRKDLHLKFDGQQQGGISTPSKHPFIFLFTGVSGSVYGYQDKWDDKGVYHYTGEGQIGPMKFSKGNLAIKDHIKNGKDLFLFEQLKRGNVRFISQVLCDGYDIAQGLDRLKNKRDIIIFQLSSKVEDKMARICWNEFNWQRPSGPNGKSKDKKSYELQTGYGHEEWLFDTEKIINSYHYGYLQQVKDKYKGKIFSIFFYSINSQTREKWWIGRIKEVEIISKDESSAIYDEYKKRGWINEMVSQLKIVGADSKAFSNVSSESFFNLKYKIDNLKLEDSPLRVSNDDKSIKSYYYKFLNKESEPKLEVLVNEKFKFNPQHKTRRESSKASYGKRETDIDLFHNRMTDNSYKQLTKIYGEKNVGTDQDTGLGSQVDLVIKDKDSYIFYEFKTSNSIRSCIRDALSQLLEYAYYPNQTRASKLIIVSQNKVNKEAQEYLCLLRNNFKIPIYYKYYNSDRNIVEDIEY